MNNIYKLLIPIIVLTFVFVGCSGSNLANDPKNVTPVENPTDERSASWNPFAPDIETIPLETALETSPAISADGRTVTALKKFNHHDLNVHEVLVLDSTDDSINVSVSRSVKNVSLYIQYDSSNEHVLTAEVNDKNLLGMAIVESGLVSIGAYALDGMMSPGDVIATVKFAVGAETKVRHTSAISRVERSTVNTLNAVYDGAGGATLTWMERHNGDYNLDGEVGVNDLTPIGIYYQQQIVEGADNWANIEVVDGNEDGWVTVNDLTQIGQSFPSFITGYNVYRHSWDGVSDPPATDDGNWTLVPNTGGADQSAPRQYNGQKTRLQYTFLDQPDPGAYAYYVVPTGRTTETPFEGNPSNVATTELGPPSVRLEFEIQSPDNEFLNVGDEFYVGIKVSNVEGLFSSNVRFEFDSSLVAFIDAVASYTDTDTVEHPNFLEPPLFIGAEIGDVGDDYRQVGFNATQTKGTAGKTGEGIIGYVKFRALVAGNGECFRFPQSTTYLYLWGETYGVAVGAPELGDALSVNIANN